MALVRAAGVPVNREMMLGTLFGGEPGAGRCLAGFLLHLAISGLLGLLYAGLLHLLRWRPDGKTGALLSPAHFLLSGLFFWAMDGVHPLIPERLPAPGPFVAHFGARGVVLVFAVKVAYGAFVGEGYGRLRRRPA
jgi:hypothetical protein